MPGEKTDNRYAYLIFAGCCCVSAGTLALATNIAGVFLIPGAERLGVGTGDYSLWLAISGVVSALCSGFWGKHMPKHCRLCFTAVSLCLVATMLTFAFATSIVHIALAGILIGLAIPPLFMVGVPVVLGNWFAGSKRSRYLGIATAFTGMGTFAWAPLFTAIIQAYGVQVAYLVDAGLACLLTLPFSLFVVVFSPKERGLEPVGAQLVSQERTSPAEQAGHESVSADQAAKMPAFWLLVAAVTLSACGTGLMANQMGIAHELFDTRFDVQTAITVGTSIISICAIGDLTGKLVFGPICNRIGVKWTITLYLGLVILALFVWANCPIPALCIAVAFPFGFNNSVTSVGLPLVCREIFGSGDYSHIWGRLCIGLTLFGGASGSIFAYIYQFTGTYVPALALAALCFVTVVVCTLVAKRLSSENRR